MERLMKGADNACNFLWVEDVQNDRCRMIDWDFSRETLGYHIEEFLVRGFSVNEYGDWKDGLFTIRDDMNGCEEIAWRGDTVAGMTARLDLLFG